MLNNTPFYHGTIRNTIVAFGRLFSNIYIERRNNDGDVEQTIPVPIAYSQKEKWVQSIEQNPTDTPGVYTTLPRMAFEIVDYSYDSQRKLPLMNKITCKTDDTETAAFVPVPYNIGITLSFATKNQEDALQILEQILPTFSPSYTLTINAIPDLNLKQDVPFILNSVGVQDDYDGDLETRRFVIHTLTFTAKINLYGGLTNSGIIKDTEVLIKEETLVNDETVTNYHAKYTAEQETQTSDVIEVWLEGNDLITTMLDEF